MKFENMTKEQILKAMKERHNGCPLFDGREKGSLDDLTDKEVTIEDFFKFTGDDGDYYAVTFKECPDVTFLSGGGLTSLLDEFGEHSIGVKIRFLEKVKTKRGNHDYRPINVVG